MTMTAWWYGGTTLGSTVLRYLLPALRMENAGSALTGRAWRDVVVFSIPVVAAGVLNGYAHAEVPVTILRPVHQAAEIVLPLTIALFVFQEAKNAKWYLTVGALSLAVVGAWAMTRAQSKDDR